jgi:predicted acyltransferase
MISGPQKAVTIMKKREEALDALRGLAILLMVLSSSISFGILPAWMYHAQVPPPYHVFKPELPGITWVDLVFPFFLFTMGAAIPLALHKKLDSQSALKTAGQVVQRFLLLVVFALFTFYARAWVLSATAGWKEYLLSIACFFVLFLMYGSFNQLKSKTFAWGIKIAGFALAAAFLYGYPFKNGFSLNSSDIIIIVLANMALFGTLIWWLTRNYPLLRIGILPLVMAILLTAKEAGSWNSAFFNWSPLPWMYKFYYLKYLFIVLPGTFAGEWLLDRNASPIGQLTTGAKAKLSRIAILCGLLLICNVVCLYARWLSPNLLLSAVLSLFLLRQLKRMDEGSDKILFIKFANAGAYLLILGLFFEAFEGGIKKDSSTFSYYFLTTGLAFLTLLSFCIFERLGYIKAIITYLGDNGKNPMVAYTAGNLFLIPLLKLSGTDVYLDNLANLPAGGFLRGLIFTGVVSLITLCCTRVKLFWKT